MYPRHTVFSGYYDRNVYIVILFCVGIKCSNVHRQLFRFLSVGRPKSQISHNVGISADCKSGTCSHSYHARAPTHALIHSHTHAHTYAHRYAHTVTRTHMCVCVRVRSCVRACECQGSKVSHLRGNVTTCGGLTLTHWTLLPAPGGVSRSGVWDSPRGRCIQYSVVFYTRGIYECTCMVTFNMYDHCSSGVMGSRWCNQCKHVINVET